MRRLMFLTLVLLLSFSPGVNLLAQSESTEVTPAVEVESDTVLRVIETLPANGVNQAETTSAIVVIFNQPVVPLVASDDMADLPQPLQFTPPVEGHGEWVNTSIYTFRAMPALAAGVTYTVTVDPALTTVSGAVQDEAYSWSFDTVVPRVLSMSPDVDDMAVALDSAIEVVFNQPMDTASTEDAFYLWQDDKEENAVAGSFTWSEDQTHLTFSPDEMLALNTFYTAGFVPGQATGQQAGSAALAEASTWEFITVPEPAIIGTTPQDGEIDSDSYGVRIYFASAMDRTTLADRVVIEPEPPAHASTYYSDWDNSFNYTFQLEPATDYTVRLLPGMADVYGNEITTEQVITFTTASYTPSVQLRVPGTVGLYNAYNEATELFLTHLNISEIDLTLYQINLDSFVRNLLDNPYRPDMDYVLDPDEQVAAWQMTVDVPENETTFALVDAGAALSGEDGGALPAGVYVLDVKSPQIPTDDNAYNQDNYHFMVVANAIVTMKSAPDEVLVWVNDMQTGESLQDIPVTLYDSDGNNVSGITDSAGTTHLAVDGWDAYATRLAIVDSAPYFGLGMTEWRQGIEAYNFGFMSDYPTEYQVYIYTDRPVYRPGQPVYFRGVVRQRDDVTYTLPDTFDRVPVQIFNENSEVIYEADLSLTDYGTFNGVFTLSDNAGLGYYRIYTELPVDEPGWQESGSVSFNVAEYRVPEFEVSLAAAADAVVSGETIQAVLESEYYFGGAVAGADVEYYVTTAPYFFQYNGPGYYDFMDVDFDSGIDSFYEMYGRQIASGTGTTDADGRYIITLPAALESDEYSQVWTLEATVRDESDLTVSNRTDVIVHQGQVYIGLRPQQYVGNAGQPNTIEIISVDWDSQPVAEQGVTVEVFERVWANVQEEDADGRTTWTWAYDETLLTSERVTTDADGHAQFTFEPPNAGIFRVKVHATDADGRTVHAATSVWVAGEEYVSLRQDNSNRIDLVADQSDYAIGDTAEILITSPFTGPVEALITVERGRVLHAERLALTENTYIYELPVTADYAPNVFVSVLLIKGVDDTNPVTAFRMGMVELMVVPEQQVIQLEIMPDKPTAGPRDTVTYTITATDYAGQPVQAEIGVALTDLASLSLAAQNSVSLLDYFYGERGNGVNTSTALTINVDQLTQTVLDTIKGGGGGGGIGAALDIRSEFVDTAYWDAVLTTDAQGQAQVTVTLPDNLTTWRLHARAVTSGADGVMLVGDETFDLQSARPLMIRPVTPRFAVAGDALTLAAVVHNNTDDELTVNTVLSGTGFIINGDAEQQVTVSAGQTLRVEWPVTIETVDALNILFAAESDDGQWADASKPTLGQGDDRLLPVYAYTAPDTVGTAGVLDSEGNRTESVMLPENASEDQGALDVRLEPSLAATTLGGLDYLRNYPYQSVEQTVSRFLPNIVTYRALQTLGVQSDEQAVLVAELDEAVSQAIQQLVAQQKTDGGWGWFSRDESDTLVTAYALIGLAEARQSDFAVAENVITEAQRYLRRELSTPKPQDEDWQLNRQAFMLYALARSGAPNVGRTVNLYDERARLDVYAKALLAQTLNTIDPSDNRLNTLISDLVNAAEISATGAHWQEARPDTWNWNTDTRTTAIVLDTLIQLSPESELLPNAVRWLVTARTADHWETTQETAWAVMALTNWMLLNDELTADYSYSLTLNDGLLASGTVSADDVTHVAEFNIAIADLLVDQANSLIVNRGAGDGALYYTAHLRTFQPVADVEPFSRGLTVQRRYVDPQTGEPIAAAQVGQLVEVHLTVITPYDRHYVMIEDPLPAGAEGVNPNLDTSQQTGTRPQLDNTNPLSMGWGWWWFGDISFHDDKVTLASSYLPAGTYEYIYYIRAGVVGEYQVLPPTGYETYQPEIYGRGAGSSFTITPAE